MNISPLSQSLSEIKFPQFFCSLLSNSIRSLYSFRPNSDPQSHPESSSQIFGTVSYSSTDSSTINANGVKFSPSHEQFKCLIFACGLKSASDRDVCTNILSKIEQNPDNTLQQVTEECRRLVNLKHNSDMVQRSVSATTSTINNIQRQQSPEATQKKSPSACRNCGGWPFARICPFKTHCYREHNRQSHKDGFCTPPGRKTSWGQYRQFVAWSIHFFFSFEFSCIFL